MKEKKSKYKSVMFTKAELKAAWLACSNYTTKSPSVAQTRVAHKLQKALLEMYI